MFQAEGVGTGTFPGTVAIDDGTSTNRMAHYLNDFGAGALNYFVRSNLVGQADITSLVVALTNTTYKQASVYGLNDFASTVNTSALSIDQIGTVPVGMTTIRIGSGDQVWYGPISRITYYPTRLLNTQLQTITNTEQRGLLAKWRTTGNQRSYVLSLILLTV
jgi:hypothetical protein